MSKTKIKPVPLYPEYAMDKNGVIYHNNEVYCDPRKGRQELSQVTIYQNGQPHLLTIHELRERLFGIPAPRLAS